MANEICTSPGCQQNAVVHSRPVWKRRVRHAAQYCEEHIEVFLANYHAEPLRGEGPPQRWGNAVGFDIELLLLDERRERACHLSLREIGGKRRLDCGIGIFEAAALQRELEGLAAPRPLTHRAMASLVMALGGRLECVLVDKLLTAERIYEAKLHIRQATAAVVVDVRLSDAVVLAVICDAPIFVSDEVLARLPETQR